MGRRLGLMRNLAPVGPVAEGMSEDFRPSAAGP